jgi:hypothetical protein
MAMVLLSCALISVLEMFNLYLSLCFTNNVNTTNFKVSTTVKLYINLCSAVTCCGRYLWPISGTEKIQKHKMARDLNDFK